MTANQVDPRHKGAKETRYRVVDHTGLTVEVQCAEGDVEAFEVELLDISEEGAMLRASRPFGDQDHTVKISSNELNGPLYVDVQVCWSQLKAARDWRIGCTFQPAIPRDVLAGLTSAGVIDRRENRRDPSSIDTTAQWELELEQIPVRIVDISREGFCLTSERSSLPGSRVLLRLEEDSQDTLITARIRWQIEGEDGYTIGCEVPHEHQSVLRKMLASSERENAPSVWKRLLGRT